MARLAGKVAFITGAARGQGRRMVADQADVRVYDGPKAVLDDGVARLGRLDIVVANAGIVSFAPPRNSPSRPART